jgi:hypothetical protein
LEKEVILARAEAESDRLTAGTLTQELERAQGRAQELGKALQEAQDEGCRARALAEEVDLLKRGLEAARGESHSSTVELARLKREQRHCLSHVEGLLTALTRLSRDSARESSLQLLESLFRGKEQDGEGEGTGTGVEQLWARLRAVLEAVRGLLQDRWAAQDAAKLLEEQATQAEAHRVTAVARAEGMDGQLSAAVAELKHAHAQKRSLEAAAEEMRASLQALQGQCGAMEEKLADRDRFFGRLAVQLGLRGGMDGEEVIQEERDMQASITARLGHLQDKLSVLQNQQEHLLREHAEREVEWTEVRRGHTLQLPLLYCARAPFLFLFWDRGAVRRNKSC